MSITPMRADLAISPFPTRRRPRIRRWVWIGVAAASISAGIAMSIPILQGKTSSPEYGLVVAAREIEQARMLRADRWAPELLASAEGALQSARLDIRLEKVQLPPFRDFTAARLQLERASSEAREAARQTQEAKGEAESDAQISLVDAETIIGTAEELARAASVSAYDRGLIQRAKSAFHEARIFFDDEDYVPAREAAAGAQATVLRVITRAEKELARYGDHNLISRWRNWIDDTIAWSRENSAPALIVNKEKHRLSLYSRGALVKSYSVELGYNSVRDKRYAGDAATPEGRYHITSKKGTGQSTYHRALLLNYPNDDDRREFASLRRTGQLPRSAGIGGLIEIHGEGGRGKDWTKGCVALSNSDIDELFRNIEVGTPVTIVGGDGSGGLFTNLIRETGSKGSGSKPETEPSLR